MEKKIIFVLIVATMALCLVFIPSYTSSLNEPTAETQTVKQVYSEVSALGYSGSMSDFITLLNNNSERQLTSDAQIDVENITLHEGGTLYISLSNNGIVDCGNVKGTDALLTLSDDVVFHDWTTGTTNSTLYGTTDNTIDVTFEVNASLGVVSDGNVFIGNFDGATIYQADGVCNGDAIATDSQSNLNVDFDTTLQENDVIIEQVNDFSNNSLDVQIDSKYVDDVLVECCDEIECDVVQPTPLNYNDETLDFFDGEKSFESQIVNESAIRFKTSSYGESPTYTAIIENATEIKQKTYITICSEWSYIHTIDNGEKTFSSFGYCREIRPPPLIYLNTA